MRCGLNVSTSAAPGADPVARAREAERLGFDFVSASDHPCTAHPTMETWTMLSWIAAATSRITIATRVLGVPYRNPAMVAKMAETFDRLSGGRLILGLGGGYSDEEFRSFGIPVPTPRDKIDGLEDAIRIARGLWSEPAFTHAGRVHHVDAADLEPKPERDIPIWLGTFGPRALDLTGRLADGWIPSLDFAPPETARVMLERIAAAAEDAGRDPAGITRAYNVGVRIGGQAEDGPGLVSGPPGAVIERLLGFVEIGFNAFNFMPAGPDMAEQVERLAHEVLPALREETAAPAWPFT
ncbi:LLM class flavin-dependent oxidoreductase [Actinomadura violacea]|uniref:LLM class flavin-dependent oxidoreductase n=1 Tax=Actinomadura violacea TaxID=2819934 RepID=A0ABS3S530_9ACTN|nr:LLM class flavin-dependent oxidoreductase [Actinomadura violacea]MBO2464115.1 LLM class flavin-dependent oxidoreductase [Actinomadura violacea]